jgi:hypothetical protein
MAAIMPRLVAISAAAVTLLVALERETEARTGFPATDPSPLAECVGAESIPASGESLSSPRVLEELVGRWEGSGQLFGAAATFVMSWTPVLDGSFLELEYEIRGAVRMNARAHYRVGEGERLPGVWIDSRGEILSLAATATDSTLVTEWASTTENGRTAYRIDGSAGLEVCDFVPDGAGWRLFGVARYTRTAGAPRP